LAKETDKLLLNTDSPDLIDKSIEKPHLIKIMIAGCILLVILASMHAADRPIGAGDTWVAMACGRYSLGPWAAKQPDRTWQMKLLDIFGVHITKQDPLSAKSRPYNPNNPKEFGWVNQNWLTHVLFYKMYNGWGENSIVVYKFIQAILTGLLAYWAARVMGAHAIFAAAAAAFGMLLSRSFIDLRPNVSSIFFASIMIMLLGYWKKDRFWALAWMIPVMLVWSNVHGGFIYAILIFVIMIGGHLAMMLLNVIRPDTFAAINKRGFSILLLMGAVVTAIPAVFSPFGFENLTHPLIVATGAEGKVWRDVIEWKPIWDEMGFGNAGPYIYFLWIFVAVFLAWWVLYFCKPRFPQPRGRRQRRETTTFAWPRIDLAQLGVMAVTVFMSVKSRRFVFLGGVMLAPFLAQMAQEIVNMGRLLYDYKKDHTLPKELLPMPKRLTQIASISVITAALVMGVIFSACMWDLYYAPPYDGQNLNVFERMSQITAQPVRAIKFFDANDIQGIVFNEWTQGGFVAFGQKKLDPETGEPACKLYIDGRAQAAYTVDHFTHRGQMMEVVPQTNAQYRARLQQLAQSLDISTNDSYFYDKLFQRADNDRELMQKLYALAAGEANLYITLRHYELDKIISRLGLDKNDPQIYDKLIQVGIKEPDFYDKLTKLSVGSAQLYDKLLKHEGVNVALVSLATQNKYYIDKLLEESENWQRFYIDERDTIYIRKDDPANQRLFQVPISELNYPDELSRKFSLGYNYCQSDDPNTLVEGMQMLMSIQTDIYLPLVYNTIFKTGLKLKKYSDLFNYFSRERKINLTRLEANNRFGRLEDYRELVYLCNILSRFSIATQDGSQKNMFLEEKDKYTQLATELAEHIKEGWLW